MPELEKVQNVTTMARKVQEALHNDLFRDEFTGTEDVHKACLPTGKSLIEENSDFILHRFTGSEMYKTIEQTLHAIQELFHLSCL